MNDGTMIESGLGTMVINDGEDDSTMKSVLFFYSLLFFFSKILSIEQILGLDRLTLLLNPLMIIITDIILVAGLW